MTDLKIENNEKIGHYGQTLNKKKRFFIKEPFLYTIPYV